MTRSTHTGGKAILAELDALVAEHSCAEAADIVCRRRNLRRGSPTTAWTSLFSPPGGGPVMELGAGFGDDTLALAARGARVIGAVPDEANARLLSRRLAEVGCERVEVIELPGLTRLPARDGSLAGIALPHAVDSGFGLTRRSLASTAREFARVLAPGGAALFGLPSALGNLLRRGVARLAAGGGPDTLNRAVKRRPAGLATSRPNPQQARAAFELAGLAVEEVFAPLPDEERPAYVIPLDDPATAAYFLSHVIRRDTALVDRVAKLAGRRPLLDRLGHLVPYTYLCLRSPAAAGGAP